LVLKGLLHQVTTTQSLKAVKDIMRQKFIYIKINNLED
jgi:hypothetical protein